MGDYSLGHFRFALKLATPDDVKDSLHKLMSGDGFSIGEHRIYLGSSAYHSMPTFSEYDGCREYEPGSDGIYCLTFQIKFGCRQLEAFANWLSPHVVVNKWTKGFFGYSISEYSNTPTVFVSAAPKNTDSTPKVNE